MKKTPISYNINIRLITLCTPQFHEIKHTLFNFLEVKLCYTLLFYLNIFAISFFPISVENKTIWNKGSFQKVYDYNYKLIEKNCRCVFCFNICITKENKHIIYCIKLIIFN